MEAGCYIVSHESSDMRRFAFRFARYWLRCGVWVSKRIDQHRSVRVSHKQKVGLHVLHNSLTVLSQCRSPTFSASRSRFGIFDRASKGLLREQADCYELGTRFDWVESSQSVGSDKIFHVRVRRLFSNNCQRALTRVMYVVLRFDG